MKLIKYVIRHVRTKTKGEIEIEIESPEIDGYSISEINLAFSECGITRKEDKIRLLNSMFFVSMASETRKRALSL